MLQQQGTARSNQSAESRFALPEYSLAGMDILDVGCQTGAAFEYPLFAQCRSLHGVDIDRAAIAEGRTKYPRLSLHVAPAEHLPYSDASFDCVISRVSLPYTFIPRALSEVFRVLRPQGRIFLSMHDWRHQMKFMKPTSPKRIADSAYIMWNSLLFNAFGICTPKPWNGYYESFQTKWRMRRALAATGFVDVSHERTDRHSLFEGRRAA